MSMSKEKEIGLICEQGDLGLFFDPLNEKDNEIYQKQLLKEQKAKKSNKKD